MSIEVTIRNLILGDFIEFTYTNHKGILGTRKVQFRALQYGSQPDYYPTPRFLLLGYDLDKGAMRSFDIAKIKDFKFR